MENAYDTRIQCISTKRNELSY